MERTDPQLLKVPDVAQLLGCSESTVRSLVYARRLACVHIGVGRRRPLLMFTRADVDAFVARNRVPAADETLPPADPLPRAATPARVSRRKHLDDPDARRYVS